MKMRKYDPLMLFLDKSGKDEITLSYDEIEKIIGDELPLTARKNVNWWNNNDNSHSQSAAWSDVGYRTCKICLGKTITFIKKENVSYEIN